MERLDKNDDVYILLRTIGMTDEEIDKAVEINTFLTKVLDTDIKQRLIWLKEYQIDIDEARELINRNPYIIIENFKRIRILESIYQEIGFKKLEFKDLLMVFPYAFSINPIKLENLIEEYKSSNKTNEEIKRAILVSGEEKLRSK